MCCNKTNGFCTLKTVECLYEPVHESSLCKETVLVYSENVVVLSTGCFKSHYSSFLSCSVNVLF